MTEVWGADDDVWLPSGAPSRLREFLDGKSSSVEIDMANVPWLPRPFDAPVFAEPSLSARAGSTPTMVTLEVAWSRPGPARSVFEVLIVGGRLEISSNELAPKVERQLSEWVAAVNRQLSARDRELESVRVQGRILIVTTRSPFPPTRASSSTPLPVALAGLLALRQPTVPTTPWRHRTGTAKLLSVTAVFLLFFGGAAVVAATFIDDLVNDEPTSEPEPEPEPETPTSVVTSTASTVSTTTQPPGPCEADPEADECALAPPGGPPVTPSSTSTTSTTSSSSTTSTTSSTTTTTLPPGPCANDPDADVAACPPPPPPGFGDDDSPTGDSGNGNPGGGGVECEGSDVPADSNNDGINDTCVDIYTQVLPPTGGAPVPGQVAPPPRPIPATGSDSNVPLQLGVLLILAGLIALVAAHRRAGPIAATTVRETQADSSEEGP